MSKLINPFWFADVGDCDADSNAFNTAVGTLDATEEAAICTLVATLKTDGLYTKCFAIFPFAGTTATEQKWQLKDPRDLDAAFRIDFTTGVNGWVHTITGAQMDTTLSLGNTFFDPDALMTPTDAGLTVAARSNSTNNQLAFGNTSTGIITISRTTLVGGRVATSTFTGSAPAGSVAEGVATITRTGTTQNAYKDSALEGGPATVSGSALNSSLIAFGKADLMEFCFGVIHEGLDATEVANLHAAIDTYSDTYAGRKNW